MNELRIFENAEFGNLRTIMIDEEPWFVGKDVAEALGYSDTYDAIKKHVDDEDKQNWRNACFESPRGMTIINESGVYSLILRSKLPTAKKFKRWVTSEVLPSIRKTGQYTLSQLTPEQEMAKGLLAAQKIIDEMNNKMEKQVKLITMQNQYIGELEPKAEYTDKVLDSDVLVNISTIAADYGMSGCELNRLLGELKVQYRFNNKGRWYLYKKYKDKGYVHTRTFIPEGHTKPVVYTAWTQRGSKFIHDLLKENGKLTVAEILSKNKD